MANFDSINEVLVRKPKHSYQDLSHDVKFSTEFGALTPTNCFILAPGEKVRMSSDIFVRMAPMYVPVMHNIDVYHWTFAVPLRLLYQDFEKFLTGGSTGEEKYPFPRGKVNLKSKKYTNRSGVTIDFDYTSFWKSGTLADYLGLPVLFNGQDDSTTLVDIEAPVLPFRCYHYIWNEYFRNQNIEAEEFNYTDGDTHDIAPQYLSLRYRNYSKDYFTSALPFTQRGEDVLIPMDVDIVFDSANFTSSKVRWRAEADLDDVTGGNYVNPSDGVNPVGQDSISRYTRVGLENAGQATGSRLQAQAAIDNSENLKGINASATINNLREAIAMQEFNELSARVGSRYIEYILGFYGVLPQDARLQRPEYLGGYRQPINVNAVVQTSGDNPTNAENNVLGSLAGMGTSVGSTDGIEFYTADEFTMIMSIMCVCPQSSYMQGMPKHLDQSDRFDFINPMFVNLGEQPILNKEVLFGMDNANHSTNDGTFGYTARYNEYRFLPDRVAGSFRDSLRDWHLARYFDPTSRPLLNREFIKVLPSELNRIFNYTGADFDHFWCEIYNRVDAWRVIPRLGIPKLNANGSDE